VDRHLVTGLILAGGRARRMEGRDKGLVALQGRPLVAHVAERFAPQVGGVVVSANRNQDAYAAFGHAVIADVLEGFAGPLAGLHAGLTVCATPLLATVPCDAPRLPRDLVERLHAALAPTDALVAAPFAAARLQPAFMLCRREILAELERHLAQGGRKIHSWLKGIGVVRVPFADADAFINLNTPAELAGLEIAPCSKAFRQP
jgi:molybdopterin-guanine dinucleotide biosynthesis protein A